MSLITLLAHFLVWATFNVRKTPRKVNTHNFWIVRQLLKELNKFFSVLLSINLRALKLKYLFLIFKRNCLHWKVLIWAQNLNCVLGTDLRWICGWSKELRLFPSFPIWTIVSLPAELYKHPSKKNLEKCAAVIQLLIITILLLYLVT